MNKNTTFITLITALIMAGSYGVYSIIQQNKSTTGIYSSGQHITLNPIINELSKSTVEFNIANDREIPVSADSYSNQILADIIRLLDQSEYTTAVELLDSLYQQLSAQDLEEFEDLFLSTARRLRQTKKSSQAITLLTSYNETFNSLDGWTLLSSIYLDTKNWPAGINALLKAAALEYQPDKLEVLMANLIAVASSQRALLEGQKDELGINRLYQNLYQHHPDNARFQLELASSYLRLNDTSTAKRLLEALQYDAEYGAIARQKLSSLEDNSIIAIEQPIENKKSRNEIVVPLQRSGNSFFANTIINNNQLRLLLDTGASITALSTTTIQSLKLKPTGRKIQLSTANGVTQSKLYRADQIRLGSLTIKNLVVAEIDFNKNSQIHGLLGTDLLNQLDSRYSYVIDNQKNALIFKSKN